MRVLRIYLISSSTTTGGLPLVKLSTSSTTLSRHLLLCLPRLFLLCQPVLRVHFTPGPSYQMDTSCFLLPLPPPRRRHWKWRYTGVWGELVFVLTPSCRVFRFVLFETGFLCVALGCLGFSLSARVGLELTEIRLPLPTECCWEERGMLACPAGRAFQWLSFLKNEHAVLPSMSLRRF